MRINRSNNRHVLLTRQYQLVVNDVIGQVTKSVEGRGRMKVHRDGGTEVLELADSFHASGLVEVGAADGFAV
jgi:hypothetical protein